MVKPLGDRIVVQKIDLSRIRASGLVLPDSIREQSDRGEVVAVGTGTWASDGELVPMPDVVVGDTVVFSPYAGSQVVVGDEEFLVLRVGDVLGILVGEQEGQIAA